MPFTSLLSETLAFLFLGLLPCICRVFYLVNSWRWLSGKESACQCRRHRFHPWSGKIPRATERLSPSATITPEPGSPNCWALRPRVSATQERPLQWGAHTPQLERSPHQPQKAHTAAQTRHRQKDINKNYFKIPSKLIQLINTLLWYWLTELIYATQKNDCKCSVSVGYYWCIFNIKKCNFLILTVEY